MLPTTADIVQQGTASGPTKASYDSADGARAVVVKNGKVLLLLRSTSSDLCPGMWCLPGGHLKEGETLEYACRRELLEETGLAADLASPHETLFAYPGGFVAAFAYTNPSGELRVDPEESSDYCWAKPGEMPMPLMSGTVEIVTTLWATAHAGSPSGSNFQHAPKLDGMSYELNVQRIDRGEFRKPVKTPEGYLKVDAYATRTGVFTYMDASGGIRRELRIPEHVFEAASLITLAEKPVTDEHPSIGLLDSTNATKYAKGWTGAAIGQDGEFVTASVTILDAALIDEIESGRKPEVSCGYACDLLQQSGSWKGSPYDAIQTNIRYNHLAVVPKGRAGSEVRLRLDASEQVDTPNIEEVIHMAKINIDGAEFEVSESVAAAFVAKTRADSKSTKDMEEEMDAAKKEMDSAKSKFDKMKAEFQEATDAAAKATEEKDKAEAKADSLQEQLKGRLDTAGINSMVKERVALEAVAAKACPTIKLDTLDNLAVKAAVVTALLPEAKLDGKSEAYIEGRYDSALELLAKRADSSGRLHKDLQDVTTAGGRENKAADAEAKMRADAAAAWQQPLGKSRS